MSSSRMPGIAFVLLLTVGCLKHNDSVLLPADTAGSGEAQPPSQGAAMTALGATGTESANRDAAMPANQGADKRASSGSAGATPVKKVTEKPAASGGTGATPANESTDQPAMSGVGAIDAGSATDAAVAMNPIAAETPAGAATDADCDFNGVWAAHQLTVSEAIGIAATSNNWYYLELTQSGGEVVITEEYDCGIQIESPATVTITRQTLEAQLSHNKQIGRKASIAKVDGKCVFEAERFWSIRGAIEERFLPATRNSTESIAQMAAAKPLPTMEQTDGAIDTEGDGELGIAFQVTGIATGTRNSVQRDWTSWYTADGFEITPSHDWLDLLVIRADFDNEESVLQATSALVASPSTPSASAKHELRLMFLGRDRSAPKAAAIIQSTKTDTCYAIQDAMPSEAL